MEKKFARFELTAIKNAAKSTYYLVEKKNKINEKIKKLEEELENLVSLQEEYEAPIRKLTGGYSSEELVERVSPTKWVFKYPETILPVEVEEQLSEPAQEIEIESI